MESSSSPVIFKASPKCFPKSLTADVFRTVVAPLLLMIFSPPAVQFVWVVCYHYDGSIKSAASATMTQLWSQFPSSSLTAATFVLIFLIWQLALLIIIPGRIFTAVPTPMGNHPEYTLNGISCFLITHAVLSIASFLKLIRYGALYDHFGEVLAFLNKSAIIVTVLLYIRGIYFPTNSDSGKSGHGFIWDVFQGTELHPEIFGVSLKQLINCRFAMMGWSVAVVSFAVKQREIYGQISNSMLISSFLQMVYIFKFFLWEGGYFNSVDIIHDRFGFYIFWGCSAFLPSIYTLTSYFLTMHPVEWSTLLATMMTLGGLTSVCCNYWADRQRQYFRETSGTKSIWGRAPLTIDAKYTTGDGKERHSLLLASGWWGVVRHINYDFEILLAFCWSLPAGFRAVVPYFYLLFLTILLTDRAYRDEIRCSSKYGQYYDDYCRLVPWKMIPGVY